MNQSTHTWSDELDDVLRGVGGAFLFGVPLLYTQEVWQLGSLNGPTRMLVALPLAFVLLVVVNRTVGFRGGAATRWSESVADAVEALAIGTLCAVVVLWLIRRITGTTSVVMGLGMVVWQAIPCSLGVALANEFLGDEGEDAAPAEDSKADQRAASVRDVGATAIGAMVIGLNIAPTGEIPLIAAALHGPWLLALIAASIAISYLVVFEAGFTKQAQRAQHRGLFQHPVSETIVSYLVSLVVASVMLWCVRRLDGGDNWRVWLPHVVALGLPATIGGAAGRLAV